MTFVEWTWTDMRDRHTEEDKARKEELKHEAKARKEEEKAAKAEEKRLAKEEKASGGVGESAVSDEEATDTRRSRLLPFAPKVHTKEINPASNTENDPSASSPTSNNTSEPAGADNAHSSKVRNWLKSHLHKPRAKSISFIKGGGGPKAGRAPGVFVGGHRLTGSLTSLSEARSASMTEVALAGTRSAATTAPPPRAQDEVGESSRAQGGEKEICGDGCEHDKAAVVAADDGHVTAAAKEAMANMEAANRDSLREPHRESNRDSKFIEIIE